MLLLELLLVIFGFLFRGLDRFPGRQPAVKDFTHASLLALGPQPFEFFDSPRVLAAQAALLQVQIFQGLGFGQIGRSCQCQNDRPL